MVVCTLGLRKVAITTFGHAVFCTPHHGPLTTFGHAVFCTPHHGPNSCSHRSHGDTLGPPPITPAYRRCNLKYISTVRLRRDYACARHHARGRPPRARATAPDPPAGLGAAGWYRHSPASARPADGVLHESCSCCVLKTSDEPMTLRRPAWRAGRARRGLCRWRLKSPYLS